VYTRHYQSPTWPKGKSGATIGVGYDIGYTTAEWFAADWSKYLTQDVISRLAETCGVTGVQANTHITALRDIRIPWSVALAQFLEVAQPQYVGETEEALSNTNELSPDSLGALVSLVYNRGATFSVRPEQDQRGRYTEMRNIKTHMARRDYTKIPAELRNMKRLWIGVANMRGLISRRELEAQLFELGLQPDRAGNSGRAG